MQNLYGEGLWNNHKGNKIRLEKWNDIPCSWKGKQHYKYISYPKLIHKFNITLIKITRDIFWGREADCNVYVEKWNKTNQKNSKKQEWRGTSTTRYLKNYEKLLDLHFTLHTTINSKCIRYSVISFETIKVLEDDRELLYNLGRIKAFLTTT